jgi:2-dehydropantoate 2-reductase
MEQRNFTYRIETKSWDGSYDWKPDGVYKTPAEASGETWDYIIVATKVLKGFNVADWIDVAVSPKTTLILLQNGLDIEKPLLQRFPNNVIVPGSVYVACSRADVGIIRHFNVERVLLGLYQDANYEAPKDAQSKIDKMIALWQAGKTNVQTVPDIESVRQHKNLWNATFAALQILSGGMTTDQLMEDEHTSSVCRAYLEELWTLSEQVLGARFPPPQSQTVEAYMQITKSLGAYKSSMLLDFEAGRPTEVECILGAPWRRAMEFHGSQAQSLYPRLHLVYSMVKARIEMR